jgi:2-polyprenyl-3-methyl-5-hydroxy-6-metoxy-1,4-benzoquinol methylase
VSHSPVFLLAGVKIIAYTLIIMNQAAQIKLLNINQEFYKQYAASFSATRGRVQPGVRRLLKRMESQASILDVGCGNGTLARALAAGGFSGRYLGVDMSEGLLAKASEGLKEQPQGNFQFRQVDLADPNWGESIQNGPYDWLVAFAVLHHIPGKGLREHIVAGFARLVSPDSRVAVSVWQWQHSPRLRKRVLPWSKVGIDAEALERGDVLLDWRAGETVGLRYVHTFDESELSKLGQSVGFRVQETFYSDGKPGNLALYQVWGLDQ